MSQSYRHPIPYLLTLAVLLSAPRSHAQVDVNPPRPNVLLLVDSSGSMEYKTSSATYPSCNPIGTGSEKSRWIDLVEVLTGAIPDYRCKRVDRYGSAFRQEYQIPNANVAPGTLNPPDYLYPVPYHRLMSGTCSPTPTTNQNAIGYCNINASKPCSFSTSDSCTFPSADGGLLDAFQTEIRFGLMTFDSDPNASQGLDGTWSYVYGNAAQGAPNGCATFSPQEVGARNAYAPIWEGQMVTFGPAVNNNEVDMLRERNQRIQDVLISTRPYGATPIAGMLHDARNFFWYDKNPDGSDSDGSKRIAPANDPYSLGKCRDNFILLLTDGEPNMDLRPYCEGCSTCCPFAKPEDIAWSLAHETSKPAVKTFVVGFAVTEIQDDVGNTIDCEALAKEDPTASSGKCANPSSKGLKTCCTLNRIAYSGGTEKAYFASSVDKLRASLSEILSKASKGTTSRTVPVFASASSAASGTTTYRFYTSFRPKIDGSGLWQGVIDRQRFECSDGGSSPVAREITPESGDDFVNNVNASDKASRKFYTVLAKRSGSTEVYSTRSVRVKPSLDDGIGSDTGSDVAGDLGNFTGFVPAKAMAVGTDALRDQYLNWLIGKSNGTDYNRCNAKTGLCNLIADVFHSTPAVVSNPTESLRDEGYLRFSRGPARKRPLTLYTSTNDGMLHAFKVASNDLDNETSAEARVLAKANNELWAFIPPAVLPRIPSEYPNVHQRLLDGAPVVRDVAGKKSQAGDTLDYPILERDPSTLATELSDWRTILVQSYGSAYSGFFALDVTDPKAGPRFLWQLTTDAGGNELFGSGGTPTVATLYFDPSGGDNPREIAVALLPGGDGGTPPSSTSTPCARNTKQLTSPYFAAGMGPRTSIPCYTEVAARRARSLTVVRLDTGEIVRSFRLSNDDAPASISQRVNKTGATDLPLLDSPITGQPVAYPGWTGAIADRAYVGDRDGSLWRVDLASANPTKWTMKLFFDAYHASTDAYAGQPIESTPIVSTNEAGEVVILFSTGSQEDLVGTGQTTNYVYSLREVVPADPSKPIVADVNWYLKFNAGMRVAGPMTLFSSNVYFSTYTPPTTSYGCDAGTSSVWGMHFANAAEAKDLGDETNVPDAVATVASDSLFLGGKPALPKGGDATSTKRVRVLTADGSLIAKGSTIFGVGIGQLQGCYKTTEVTDPYFGTTYNRVDSGTTGKFQLVVQTGNAGTSSGQGSTNYASIDLPQPNNGPRISSWAMVME